MERFSITLTGNIWWFASSAVSSYINHLYCNKIYRQSPKFVQLEESAVLTTAL
jgi:hypothetical protein